MDRRHGIDGWQPDVGAKSNIIINIDSFSSPNL
jgi:hypothetical protein